MKQLILSFYDGIVGFSYVVLENGKEIERSKEEIDLKKYNLYDVNWGWWDKELINEENEVAKQFDEIIVCEDGGIEIYKKGEDY